MQEQSKELLIKEVERLRRQVERLGRREKAYAQTEVALRMAERRLGGILNIAADAVISTNAAQEITLFNQGAEEIFGYATEEVLGQPLEILLPHRYRTLHHKHMQAFIQAPETARIMGERSEIRALRADGTEFPAEASISKLVVGDEVVLTVILRDVSERKKIEAELRTARDQALKASHFKSQFLATMSHEVRTPMNGIIGMADLLEDTSLNSLQREYLGIIQESANALLTIINDILDFSRIEAGRLELEADDFNPLDLVEGTVELLASRSQEKGLRLFTYVHKDVPAEVRGDPIRIRQVLLNLVGNAIKFTEAGEVFTKVEVAEELDLGVLLRFSVCDTGVGIPPDIQERLFEPFVQGNGDRQVKSGGSGLGLAISKRLVELMGGEIEMVSQEGKGSTFSFTVPVVRRVQGSPLEEMITEWDCFNGVKALVIDSHPNRARVLCRYLENWGIQAETAADGAEAIKKLKERTSLGSPYSLVLLDHRLSDMGGRELSRTVRQLGPLCNLPLLLLTPFDWPVFGGRPSRGDFAAYLSKPVRRTQLLETVARTVLDESIHKRLFSTEEVEPPPRKEEHEEEATFAAEGGRILVAEDNEVNQRVITFQLEKAGFEVELVENGREAVEAVATGRFDLVLMDCQMPELDGFEATRTIRKDEEESGRRTTIIALTANAMEGYEERCIDAGMDDYLSKPVTADQLTSMLRRWMSKKKSVSARNPKASPSHSVDKHSEIPEELSIDLERLEQLFDGDTEVIDQLLEVYISKTQSLLETIRQGIAREEYETIRSAAHELKGSSSMVAANGMAETSRHMEVAVKEEDEESLRRCLRELEHLFERVKARAERWWNEP